MANCPATRPSWGPAQHAATAVRAVRLSAIRSTPHPRHHSHPRCIPALQALHPPLRPHRHPTHSQHHAAHRHQQQHLPPLLRLAARGLVLQGALLLLLLPVLLLLLLAGGLALSPQQALALLVQVRALRLHQMCPMGHLTLHQHCHHHRHQLLQQVAAGPAAAAAAVVLVAAEAPRLAAAVAAGGLVYVAASAAAAASQVLQLQLQDAAAVVLLLLRWLAAGLRCWVVLGCSSCLLQRVLPPTHHPGQGRSRAQRAQLLWLGSAASWLR